MKISQTRFIINFEDKKYSKIIINSKSQTKEGIRLYTRFKEVRGLFQVAIKVTIDGQNFYLNTKSLFKHMKKGDPSIKSKKQAIELFKQKISDAFTSSSPTSNTPTSNPNIPNPNPTNSTSNTPTSNPNIPNPNPTNSTSNIPTSNPGTSVKKDFEYRDYTTQELYEMTPVSPQSPVKISLLDKMIIEGNLRAVSHILQQKTYSLIPIKESHFHIALMRALDNLKQKPENYPENYNDRLNIATLLIELIPPDSINEPLFSLNNISGNSLSPILFPGKITILDLVTKYSGNLDLLEKLLKHPKIKKETLHFALGELLIKGKLDLIKFFLEKLPEKRATEILNLSFLPGMNGNNNAYSNRSLITPDLIKSGTTPLHLLCKITDFELIKKGLSLFIEKGVNLEIRDTNGETVLQAAVSNKQLFDHLLSTTNADPKTRNDNGFTLLHSAIEKGRVDLFSQILEKEGISSEDKWAALNLAINSKNKEILKLLLENKVEITPPKNPSYPFAETSFPYPLHFLIDNSSRLSNDLQLEMLELFLEHKELIDIEKINRYDSSLPINSSCTPLHLAIKKKNTQAVEKLLAHNASIRTLHESTKNNALHQAIEAGSLEIVQLLLNSAQKNPMFLIQQNDSFRTPLVAAILKGNRDIINLLLKEEGINPERVEEEMSLDPFSAAVKTKSMDLIERITPFNIDYVGENSYTALHWAVWTKNVEVVKAVLKKNPNPNIKTTFKEQTPLDLARENRSAEIIEVLENYAKSKS